MERCAKSTPYCAPLAHALPGSQRVGRQRGDLLLTCLLDPLFEALRRELGTALQDLRDFRRHIVALRKLFGWIVHEVFRHPLLVRCVD